LQDDQPTLLDLRILLHLLPSFTESAIMSAVERS